MRKKSVCLWFAAVSTVEKRFSLFTRFLHQFSKSQKEIFNYQCAGTTLPQVLVLLVLFDSLVFAVLWVCFSQRLEEDYYSSTIYTTILLYYTTVYQYTTSIPGIYITILPYYLTWYYFSQRLEDSTSTVLYYLTTVPELSYLLPGPGRYIYITLINTNNLIIVHFLKNTIQAYNILSIVYYLTVPGCSIQ